ncbi:MAG: alkaline phosphatase D family protein, partial [Planctomycetaceae bacterium]
MIRRLSFVIIVLLIAGGSGAVRAEEPLSKIAFGSCARQGRPQPIWEAIVETEPEVFLFIGDNIYGDTTDMAELKAKWEMLGSEPGYQKLKETCPILAVWDDHDYGANDAGREYPKKRESQQIFVDFFEDPADSPRRQREGVYLAKTFGPEGKRVQIILLDTRYFRSPLSKSGRKYEAGSGVHGGYAPNLSPE